MKNMTSSNFIYKWNTHNLKLQLPSAVYLATDKTYQHFIWLSIGYYYYYYYSTTTLLEIWLI